MIFLFILYSLHVKSIMKKPRKADMVSEQGIRSLAPFTGKNFNFVCLICVIQLWLTLALSPTLVILHHILTPLSPPLPAKWLKPYPKSKSRLQPPKTQMLQSVSSWTVRTTPFSPRLSRCTSPAKINWVISTAIVHHYHRQIHHFKNGVLVMSLSNDGW